MCEEGFKGKKRSLGGAKNVVTLSSNKKMTVMPLTMMMMMVILIDKDGDSDDSNRFQEVLI